MILSKLERVILALVVVLISIFIWLLQSDFSSSSNMGEIIGQIFSYLFMFIMTYYGLGAFLGEKKDLSEVTYPKYVIKFIYYLLPVFSIVVVIGFTLTVIVTQWAFWITIILLSICLLIISMFHFYYIKKVPKIIIFLFSFVYLLVIFLLIVSKLSGIGIIILVLFAILFIFFSGYGLYILYRYMLPRLIEYKYERKAARLKRKQQKQIIKL